jgi:hypothetical protein
MVPNPPTIIPIIKLYEAITMANPKNMKKIAIIKITDSISLKDSIEVWTIRKFIQYHPYWAILSFILTVISPFVGYYWANLVGLGAGLLLGLTSWVITYYKGKNEYYEKIRHV